MIETKPLHEMKLEKHTLRVEADDLGISVLDEQGNIVFWLNAIGTATLKEWLNKSFDQNGSWLSRAAK